MVMNKKSFVISFLSVLGLLAVAVIYFYPKDSFGCQCYGIKKSEYREPTCFDDQGLSGCSDAEKIVSNEICYGIVMKCSK